jgi:hypothetical protein
MNVFFFGSGCVLAEVDSCEEMGVVERVSLVL